MQEKHAAAALRLQVIWDRPDVFLSPLGDLSFDEACENYYRLAKALANAGADCLIIETIIDIQEMKAALIAAKAASNLPVICQMTYAENGRTITGTPLKPLPFFLIPWVLIISWSQLLARAGQTLQCCKGNDCRNE